MISSYNDRQVIPMAEELAQLDTLQKLSDTQTVRKYEIEESLYTKGVLMLSGDLDPRNTPLNNKVRPILGKRLERWNGISTW